MKVIDLLNKIENKEEVPKQIKYEGNIYTYDENFQDYKMLDNYGSNWLINKIFDESEDTLHALNYELEIIKEDKEDKEDTFNGLKWFADGKCFMSLSSEPLKTKDIEVDNEIKKWNYDADCTEEWNFGEIKEKLDELVDAVNELKKGK